MSGRASYIDNDSHICNIRLSRAEVVKLYAMLYYMHYGQLNAGPVDSKFAGELMLDMYVARFTDPLKIAEAANNTPTQD